MTTLAELISFQHELVRASLRCLSAEYGRSDDPNSDAEAEYAYEQLALAARELTRAVDGLDPAKRPVDWNHPSSCCNGTGFADYAAVPCPAPDCPVTHPAVKA